MFYNSVSPATVGIYPSTSEISCLIPKKLDVTLRYKLLENVIRQQTLFYLNTVGPSPVHICGMVIHRRYLSNKTASKKKEEHKTKNYM